MPNGSALAGDARTLDVQAGDRRRITPSMLSASPVCSCSDRHTCRSDMRLASVD